MYLDEAATPPKERIPTEVPDYAIAARKRDKQHHSEKKKSRRDSKRVDWD